MVSSSLPTRTPPAVGRRRSLYHVGPLNERAGRTGFAHLFEHMMFEGSEHVGEKAHINSCRAPRN